MSVNYREYRCQDCHKLLFKGFLVESAIEVKCRACHAMNTIESSQFDKLLCAVYPCPHRVEVVKNKKQQTTNV